MRNDKLVTGGSDGSVRVWSLTEYQPIHRLAAHDNSVTSLQFDDTRIVSGGSDGRVKVWDLKTGAHVRELCKPADAVWRVVFEDEKAVIMASRGGKTVMEVRLTLFTRTVRLMLIYSRCGHSPLPMMNLWTSIVLVAL
jgi:F-box and WD-40 domain protein CDC4